MAGDRLEIIDVEERTRRAVDVQAGTVFVTVTADGDVQLGADGRGAVLQLVPTRGGRRVEPVAAGGQVTVNGEELFCKDLDDGDVVELGRIRLLWTPAANGATAVADARRPGRSQRAAPARTAAGASSRTPGKRGAAADATYASRRTRSVRRSHLAMSLTVFALALGVIGVSLRACWGSTWPSTPASYVELARAQYLNGRTDEALATLDFALREATGDAREEALRLQQEIRRTLVALVDLGHVQDARRDLDLLASFHDRYLRENVARPAAREFVRMCERWLDEHRDACERQETGRPLLQQVEAYRARYLPAAELETPDAAPDVIFAARARLRFVVREYREAIALLDRWLASHGADADVAAERERMVREGADWLRDKLAEVARALDRGDRAFAESRFEELQRDALLAEWEDLAAPLRERLGR